MRAVEERPVSAVAADIIGNVQDMVRSEVRLARAEIKIEAAQASRSASFLASGVGLGLYALALVIAVIVLLLARVMDAWLATLIVCLAVSAVALTLIAIGRRRWKRLRLAPEKTVQTVKENVSWTKTQIK